MRQCRKCGDKLPYKVKIEGKERNLQNRKFCLKCSPFGSRNTKPDDPSRQSLRRDKDGNIIPYKEWADEIKERNRAMQYHCRQERKAIAIKLKGGKCKHCGYCKCTRALCFHHRDPKEKLINLSTRDMTSNSWDNILLELEKCDLLCQNCHEELHYQEQISRYKHTTIVMGPVGFEPTYTVL